MNLYIFVMSNIMFMIFMAIEGKDPTNVTIKFSAGILCLWGSIIFIFRNDRKKPRNYKEIT